MAVLAGVFAALLGFPSTGSGALLNIHVYDDYYNPSDISFEFLDIDNPNIEWDWGAFNGDTTTQKHNVHQKQGMFDSGEPKKTGKFELEASAGSYKYLCIVHTGMNAVVRIIPKLADVQANTFEVTWANEFTETGNRYAVRYRVDGGPWNTWFKHTKKTHATFGMNGLPTSTFTDSHTYEVEARTYKGKRSVKKRSGWSPPASTT